MSDEKPPRRRRRGRRYLKFTREGRVFLLVTLGVGAGAVNTGNNLLYLVLGLLLSLIVLSGLLSEWVLRGLQIRRRLPRRSFAESATLIELAVVNRKRLLPSYSVELRDVSEDGRAEHACYFLKVAPGEEQVRAYPSTPRARGPLRLKEVIASTRYPFGLFEKSRRLPVEDELLVYPALLQASALQRQERRAGSEVATPRRGTGAELAGLRDYLPGDEARLIHWRRTARLGRPVVRERERDASRRLTLTVDELRPPGADESWDQSFERSLSVVAATAARALADGASVEAVGRSSASPLVQAGHPPDPVWRYLARIEALDELPAEGA